MTAFLPTDLTSCQLALEGSQITGLADAGAITTWPDASNQQTVVTQATAGQRALFRTSAATLLNGLPVVHFDGVNDVFPVVLPASAAWTFFSLGRITSSGGSFRLWSFAGLSQVEIVEQAGAWSYYGDQAGGQVSLGGRPGDYTILSVVLTSNAAAQVWRNGVLVATFDPKDFSSGTDLFLGARNAAGAAPATGDLAAFLAYNRALTPAERQQVEAYLSERYANLTASSQLPYLGLINGRGAVLSYQIGLVGATSLGGMLTPWNDNPVIGPGSGWESSHVKDPCLLKFGTSFVCYYSGNNGSHYAGVGRATSPDGITWTKDAGNPVLAPGVSGWDSGDVVFPFVLYDPDETDATQRWKMWYSAWTGVNRNADVGYAYSADGVTWTKYASNPVLSRGAGGTYDDNDIEVGCVVKIGTTWYLYYGGRPDGAEPTNDTICLATFTNPKSTYTKSGSNPLLANRPLALKSLTADTLIGSAIVQVADSSVFVVNEQVWMSNNVPNPILHRILSIDDATHLTLTAAVTSNYTTAQSASIRSVYYGAIAPRSLVRVGGVWNLFGASFDHNLGQLRETSVVHTAPALTGPWTIDFARGVVVAQNQSGWNTLSAENPSVIRALAVVPEIGGPETPEPDEPGSASIAFSPDRVDLGDLVRLSVVFLDVDGAAADPTTVVCKVKTPDGAVVTATYGVDVALVRDGVGLYHRDWLATVDWIHYYRFEGTGAVVAAEESSFGVQASHFV